MRHLFALLILSISSSAFAAEFVTADYSVEGCETIKCAADKPLTENETNMACTSFGGTRTISIIKKNGFILKSTDLVLKERFEEGSHKRNFAGWTSELSAGSLIERRVDHSSSDTIRLTQANKSLIFELSSLEKNVGTSKANVHRILRCVYLAD